MERKERVQKEEKGRVDRASQDLITKVMARYPGKVRGIRLLSDKGKKAVWSVNADKGDRIVKKVPFGDRDIEFMAYAVHYLRRRGVRTPAVLRTVEGNNFVSLNDERFVVFEAVRGRAPDYERKEELRMIMRGMGEFHRASRGIASPTRYYPSLLLYTWETRKRMRLERLAAWKTTASAKTKPTAFDRLFLRHVDHFIKQAQESIERLKRAGFERWVEETRLTKMLSHQDFAAGNLVIGDDGKLHVYDMDSLTVDVPLRDIRKILNKVMKKGSAGWEVDRMVAMLKWYQETNPLSERQYRSLSAELMFPHLFYGQASKYYKKRDPEWTEAKYIERFKSIIATEQSKLKALRAFEGRIGEVVSRGRR